MKQYPPTEVMVQVALSDVLELSRFWDKVAQSPLNNPSTRQFAIAEAHHWQCVADNITNAQNGGLLA